MKPAGSDPLPAAVLASRREVHMSDEIYQPAPDVFLAARTRRSIRAYQPTSVPIETVREIVALGRHAPSGSNIQPWRVHVLTGATLARVGTATMVDFSRVLGLEPAVGAPCCDVVFVLEATWLALCPNYGTYVLKWSSGVAIAQ